MNRCGRTGVWVSGITAVFTLCWPVNRTTDRLVYNPSTSAPEGWYRVKNQRDLRVNDYVLATLPGRVAALANERHYLPSSVPILKRIGAVSPQFVCIRDHQILIDFHVVARTLERDRAGRPLNDWEGCRRLVVDELFLLSATSQASFDSRYFGPIARDHVIGKAIPLWTW